MKPTLSKKSTARTSSKCSRPASGSPKREAAPKAEPRSSRAFGTSLKLDELLALPLLERSEMNTATPLELFERNTRAALHIAGSFIRRAPDLSEEFIAAALRGLWAAASRYDPARGLFLPYAAWSIRRELGDVERNQKTMHIPRHALRAHYAVLQGTATELDKKRAANLPTVSSLDYEIGEKGDLHELTASEEHTPRASVDLADLRAEIDSAIAELPEMSGYIVRKRLGLDGETPQSLEDLAKKYNLTRERIRQIEFEALKTIRSSLARRDFSIRDLSLLS